MFILVKAQPGVDVEDLRNRLQARLDGVDVLTRQRFSDMTRHYWLFTTGAGMAVLMAAVLGLRVDGYIEAPQSRGGATGGAKQWRMTAGPVYILRLY
jgi:putative ABC transport system permease protein